MVNMVVVTPWYPTEQKPYSGSFVRDWVRAGAGGVSRTDIIHLDNVEVGSLEQLTKTPSPQGQIWRQPVCVEATASRASTARSQAAALNPELVALIQAAEVVVAHVTMPTGWAVAEVVEPHQRLVLVEHASYLERMLSNDEARSMVKATVARANIVLTAGEATAAMLRIAAGEHRSKIWGVGNPLDLERWPATKRNALATDRWLYVGNLLAAKGVLRLARAFGYYAKNRPSARLTVVGEGVDKTKMVNLLSLARVLQQTDFLGALEQSEVAAQMARADLLVHLSLGETFGLAPLEAIASGLPVVASLTSGTKQTLGFARSSGRVELVDQAAPGRFARQTVKAVEALKQASEKEADQQQVVQHLRDELARRYGAPGFGQMLSRVWAGQAPYADQSGPAWLAVALSAKQADQLGPDIHQALWQGRQVIFASTEPGLLNRLDPRILGLDLPDNGQTPRLVTWFGRLAWVGPGLTLRLAVVVLAGLSGLPGLIGQLARRAASRARAWQKAWNTGHGRRLEAVRHGGKRGLALGQQAARLLAGVVDTTGQVPCLHVAAGEPAGFVTGLKQAWPGQVCQAAQTS